MLTTGNPDHDKIFRLLRNHGMSVSAAARHASDKVIFEDYITTGYNYRMSDIHAAIGIEQLKKVTRMIEDRRNAAGLYEKNLKGISWLSAPHEPAYCKTNWQSYPVRILDNAPLDRNRLMQVFLDSGIATRRGIMNAHQEELYGQNIKLKNSELSRDTVILLPIYFGITEKEIKTITERVSHV